MLTTTPPPWTFPNARVLYQPALVKVEAARAVTPSDGLTLLSAFGYTLGGVFVVEWTDSPIGPYREVAVLSALVGRGLSIGAWASHIIVTTPEAVDSGRDYFGLPTHLGAISFEASEGEATDPTTLLMSRATEADDSNHGTPAVDRAQSAKHVVRVQLRCPNCEFAIGTT